MSNARPLSTPNELQREKAAKKWRWEQSRELFFHRQYFVTQPAKKIKSTAALKVRPLTHKLFLFLLIVHETYKGQVIIFTACWEHYWGGDCRLLSMFSLFLITPPPGTLTWSPWASARAPPGSAWTWCGWAAPKPPPPPSDPAGPAHEDKDNDEFKELIKMKKLSSIHLRPYASTMLETRETGFDR